MRSASHFADSRLSLEVIRQIDELCDAFENRLKSGEIPRLEEFVEPHPEPVRSILLRELLSLELDYHVLRGNRPEPNRYHERFPADAPLIGLVFESAFATGSTESDAVLDTSVQTDRGHPKEDLGFPRLKRYRIIRELGRGAFGAVYLARDSELNRHVAIKRPLQDRPLSTAEREGIRREAEMAARLNHPSVVAIYDIMADDENRPCIVMEFVEGSSLKEVLAKGAMSPLHAAELLAQVADGLQHAHQAGLIHRDLKPGNILLDVEGRAHIADLGLALDNKDRDAHAAAVAGTFAYMAPEQLEGDIESIDHRCDIWAFGVILFEAMVGRRPFADDQRALLFAAIRSASPTVPRALDNQISRQLESICLKCLSKRRSERYSTAREVHDDLRQAIDLASSRRTRLLRRVVIGCVLCLLAMLGIAQATGLVDIPGLVNVAREMPRVGTLAVHLTDPNAELHVYGEQGQEVKIVKPGKHWLQLEEGDHEIRTLLAGQVVYVRQVTVRADQETNLEITPKETRSEIFLIVDRDDSFASLASAIEAARDGETIEIRGNGPFSTEPVEIGEKAMTIRAAPGFQPVIRLDVASTAPLLQTRGRLTLEGLELHRAKVRRGNTNFRMPTIIESTQAPFFMSNCRLVIESESHISCVRLVSCPDSEVSHCELYSTRGCCLWWQPGRQAELRIKNSLCNGSAIVLCRARPQTECQLSIADSTLVGDQGLIFYWGQPASKLLNAERARHLLSTQAARNVIDVKRVISLGLSPIQESARAIAFVQRAIDWHGNDNVFSERTAFVAYPQEVRPSEPTTAVASLAEWMTLWGNSCENPRVSPLDFLSEADAGEHMPELTARDFQFDPSDDPSPMGSGQSAGILAQFVGPGANSNFKERSNDRISRGNQGADAAPPVPSDTAEVVLPHAYGSGH